MGDVSAELCGGTHVQASGQIGLFKIIQSQGIANGVRRIEAITGQEALDWVNAQHQQLDRLAALMKTNVLQLEAKLKQHLVKTKQLARDLEQLQRQQVVGGNASGAQADQWVELSGQAHLLIESVPGVTMALLRQRMDQLKSNHAKSVFVLYSQQRDQRILLAVALTKDLVKQVTAPEILAWVVDVLGGSGGGRPDFAQGAISTLEDVDQLESAIKSQWAMKCGQRS